MSFPPCIKYGIKSSGNPVEKTGFRIKSGMTIKEKGLLTQYTKVMVSMEPYKDSQNELEILRLLVRSEKEIEAGKGYDLDAVLAEADSLLRHCLKNVCFHFSY